MNTPIVTLTIDDCWRDHALAFKRALEPFHLKGVYYAIAGFVGREVGDIRFATWEELGEISKNGGEIGSHSFTHKGAGLNLWQKGERFGHQLLHDGFRRSLYRLRSSLGSSTEEYGIPHLSRFDELRLSKLKIEEQIHTECKSYAYPGGGFTKALELMVGEAGYSNARTGYSGYNSLQSPNTYALKVQVWDNTVTAKKANSWIDRAISSGTWLIEVFHTIDLPNCPYNASSVEILDHFHYISSRSREIENLNMREVG